MRIALIFSLLSPYETVSLTRRAPPVTLRCVTFAPPLSWDYLEHSCAEFAAVRALRYQLLKPREKFVYPLELQPRAEKAREYLPPADHRAKARIVNTAALKVALHRRLGAHCGSLVTLVSTR